ncbi:MAG: A24 family peptidase [Schaedlerella sp.]|nr:A24 family peptidase [Schaedlerella sp.]
MILSYILSFICGIIIGSFLNAFICHLTWWERILNGVLYLMINIVNAFNLDSVFCCILASSLLALSVIDFRTFQIPMGFHIFIGGLGSLRMITDFENWTEYVMGFFAVSIVLEILFIVSKGKAIGGGDVKLMAACGLFIGYKLIWVAFFFGCILGLVIHSIRMKIKDADRVLAMGPYLSAGVLIAVLWGNDFLSLI